MERRLLRKGRGRGADSSAALGAVAELEMGADVEARSGGFEGRKGTSLPGRLTRPR